MTFDVKINNVLKVAQVVTQSAPRPPHPAARAPSLCKSLNATDLWKHLNCPFRCDHKKIFRNLVPSRKIYLMRFYHKLMLFLYHLSKAGLRKEQRVPIILYLRTQKQTVCQRNLYDNATYTFKFVYKSQFDPNNKYARS